jgi:hypothetical protein
VYCLKAGLVVAATVADHIKDHEGDEYKFLFGELQSLCKSHHDDKDFTMSHGFTNTVGADGMPLDPTHPFNK